MSELRVFQSLWATEQRIPGQPERPIGERFDRVREAGFAGMSIDLGAITLDQAAEIVPHYQRTGLGGLIDDFAHSSVDAYRDTMARLAALTISIGHGGHGPSFGEARKQVLIADYLAGRRLQGCPQPPQ